MSAHRSSRPVGTVLSREIRDLTKTRSFVIGMVISVIVNVTFIGGIAASAQSISELGHQGVAVGALVVAVAGLPIAVAFPLLGSEPMVRDQSTGANVCLLATPARPVDLVVARAVALWLPSAVIGAVMGAAVPLVFIGTGSPLGQSLPVVRLILSGAIVVPLLFLGLAMLMAELALVFSADIATAPSYVVGLAVVAGVPIASVSAGVDASAPGFFVGSCIVTAVFLLCVIAWAVRLTKEKVAMAQ